MIFHAENHVAFFGVFERMPDAFDGALDAFFARHARMALTAQGSAMADAQRNAQIDGSTLAIQLPLALGGIGMREIGREAQHRRNLPGLLEHALDRLNAVLPEKAIEVLDSFAFERGGHSQPIQEVHLPRIDLVDEALGEDANAWRGGHDG